MYPGKFPKGVMHPAIRVLLAPESPVIEHIKSDSNAPFRVVGFGGNLTPGYSVVLNIESFNGPDPLVSAYYRELLAAAIVQNKTSWRFVISKDSLSELKPFYDFLNIKYYLATTKQQSDRPEGLVFIKHLDMDAYRSDSAWPRAFFTSSISTYDDQNQLLRMIKKSAGRPFAAVQQNQRLDENFSDLIREDQSRRSIVSADNYKLTVNTTSFTVTAPSQGVIVLSETYWDDDFLLTVNGKPASYFRVNHAFRGLLVEKAGRYVVTYSYWPRHFTLLLIVSGIGAFLLLIWMIYTYNKLSFKKPWKFKKGY